jgi:3,8-divinyl chlorophyllide a/chlorophyllide a reductase subunit Y
MARALCRPRLRRGGRDPPFYTASVREFQAAGRAVVGSAPVGHDGTADWLAAIGAAMNIPADRVAAAQNAFLPAIRARWPRPRSRGRITLSGYEGSELLVARLLIESGANVPYVGTACPKTEWSAADADWLRDKGVVVNYREPRSRTTCPRWKGSARIWPSARRPSCSAPRNMAIPALYFTNLISARPLMGPAGAGSLARWSMPPWRARTGWTA